MWQGVTEKIKARQAKRKKIDDSRPIRTEFVPDEYFCLPPLNLENLHPNEIKPLFLAKIMYCKELYSCSSKEPDGVRKRNHKTETIKELAHFAKTSKLIYEEEVVKEFLEMIKVNIITQIPEYDDEDDDIFKEPQFEHIGFMLNLLALFMANKHLDAKAIKPYINPSFIRDLFRQLHHPDERIREGIKTIIHQFYVQFVGHRTFIRRNIRDQLLTFIYEDDTYRGTPHLLQVMGSIVRGYSTPLKNEHKLFLVKVLLPLHASPKFTDFSSNMSFLMVHFAQKDPSLSSVILSAVLRLWPLANTPKELELLEEVEEILSFCEPEVFSQVCNDLFKRLGKCMGSQHYQVAERSLYFLNKTYILGLIEENIKLAFPAIIPELVQTASTHWNHSIVLLVCNLLRSLMEIDEDLFTTIVYECDMGSEQSVDIEDRRSTARKTIATGMERVSDLKKKESIASLSPNRKSGSKNDKYMHRH